MDKIADILPIKEGCQSIEEFIQEIVRITKDKSIQSIVAVISTDTAIKSYQYNMQDEDFDRACFCIQAHKEIELTSH
jgi:hypothetical protein